MTTKGERGYGYNKNISLLPDHNGYGGGNGISVPRGHQEKHLLDKCGSFNDNGDNMIVKLFNDHFQNYKTYGIPKAQLIIADIPYNLGNYAYASNPSWYVDGDNKKGESENAGKEFFDTDKNFRPAEFMHFCSKLLKKEPKATNSAPCMIVFCEFLQQFQLIELAKKYGLNRYINLVFRKDYSAQVLKANMRVVGNCEYAVLFYREKLPKFRNKGKMIFNCIEYERDSGKEKIHPTQKSIPVLKKLINWFTDEGDVVIDPTAGSGTTLIAAHELNRNTYGFEIKKDFYRDAVDLINKHIKFKYQKMDLFSSNENSKLKLLEV